ncbi:unnamed protein product [Brassica napus]|nr:unnamed protein product [Brassica napus]
MAARKRPSPTSISTESDPTDQKTTHNTSDNAFHLPPLKLGSIFVISTLLCSLHLYLLCFHYKVETQLKHSILINAALSLVGFFVTLKMIHAAARYVLRRNTFRFDINKSGTPQVEVKV